MWIDAEPTVVQVGGKAYQLYRLKQLCSVPPFFVITFQDPAEISDPKNQLIIHEQCLIKKFDLMAVRSSASCEDSPQTSFAGMFKTVLGVKPPEIINAIREVLGSIFNKRVADYCEARSIDQNKIRMAVIVQRMINSRVSGVCFTRSQDERGPILIEACFGLGEALVSGKITPDLYIVDRGNFHITKETVGYQRFVLKLSEESMTPFYEELPFHKRNAKKLNNVQIVDVARTSLVIEESLSLEVADVEWAFEKDSLYILQARTFSGFKNDR